MHDKTEYDKNVKGHKFNGSFIYVAFWLIMQRVPHFIPLILGNCVCVWCAIRVLTVKDLPEKRYITLDIFFLQCCNNHTPYSLKTKHFPVWITSYVSKYIVLYGVNNENILEGKNQPRTKTLLTNYVCLIF